MPGNEIGALKSSRAGPETGGLEASGPKTGGYEAARPENGGLEGRDGPSLTVSGRSGNLWGTTRGRIAVAEQAKRTAAIKTAGSGSGTG